MLYVRTVALKQALTINSVYIPPSTKNTLPEHLGKMSTIQKITGNERMNTDEI